MGNYSKLPNYTHLAFYYDIWSHLLNQNQIKFFQFLIPMGNLRMYSGIKEDISGNICTFWRAGSSGPSC
jgi:hypothetical protein